jgi:GNAT superfamily N-acetyltransferase
MTAALNWCRDAGATGAALQVGADNPVAIKLYSSLGFTRAYDYDYRRPTVAP